jgi:putative flippase GtrA
VLDATVLRYLLVSAATFALDLAVLTATHDGLGWPLPVAVTAGYAVALSTSYLLNRVLTFRSHGPLGPETLRYAGAVAVNFGAVLLGVTTGLAALGVPYQLGRLAAGACEGVFMYGAMRWFVFPRGSAAVSPAPTTASADAAGAPRRRSGRAAR